MAVGIIIGIIIALCCIGAFIFAGASFENDRSNAGLIGVIIGIVMLIAFIIVPFSFHTVDTGKIAVVKHLGKIEHTREAGTYYDFWMTNKYVKIDTKVQEVAIDEMAYSSDAQQMTVSIKFQYQIMPDHVEDIVSKYGKLSSLENRIQPIVIEKVKSMLSQPTAMDIIANRAKLSPQAEELVKDALGEEYYINVVSVSLTNIDFSDQFEKAVEDKMIAEQNQKKAEYDNAAKVAKTEAEAKAKIIEAEANAKVKIMAAEAEAQANELLEKSLTEKILQEMYLDKWNGELPKVVTDGETILEIPDMSEE